MWVQNHLAGATLDRVAFGSLPDIAVDRNTDRGPELRETIKSHHSFEP
jgi:hypothetical protein